MFGEQPGVTTLVGFHRALLEHPCFVDGTTCHGLVESPELAARGQELVPSADGGAGVVGRTLGRSVDVEIDGGVKVENAQRAVDAGATVLVSASGIYKAPDKVGAARALAEIASRGRSTLPAREGTA